MSRLMRIVQPLMKGLTRFYEPFRKLTLNVVKGIIYLKMEMTMTMEILVDVKNVYGNILYYPACEQSKIFAKIAGNKTLTGDTLRQIQELGITVTAKTSQI